MTGAYDPIARRFVPDPALVHRAHNLLLDSEVHGTPSRRYMRQQWDAAFGATRVAMDALREIWPSEARALGTTSSVFLMEALHSLEDAYHALDSVAEEMAGWLVVAVQEGHIRTEEEFNAAVAKRAEADGDPHDQA